MEGVLMGGNLPLFVEPIYGVISDVIGNSDQQRLQQGGDVAEMTGRLKTIPLGGGETELGT